MRFSFALYRRHTPAPPLMAARWHCVVRVGVVSARQDRSDTG